MALCRVAVCLLTFASAGDADESLSQAVRAQCTFQMGELRLEPECVGAEFGERLDEVAVSARPVVVADPATGCEGEGQYEGMVVLALRGGCSFEHKSRFLASKGAAAVVVVNHEEGVLAMGAGKCCADNFTSLRGFSDFCSAPDQIPLRLPFTRRWSWYPSVLAHH